MGEMSAKHLRGRAMQDVIFAGSDSRGPLGMAEVTLTFDTEGGDVPPQYAAYSEISITRRLHRDGTSEYLINNVQMRLRDITDLFLGTGVGTRAYSIIEQGRIGFIVNSRPEDRRALIEEVAGITKFKQRKKTAERRMAATSQNLQRVRDIIAELERQLASLERQVKKAERFKRLKAEIRELDLLTAAHQLFELEGRKKSTLADVDAEAQKSGDVQRAIASMEANLEAAKLALLQREEEIQVHQRRSNEADVQVVGLQRDLDSWAAQRTQLMERMGEASLEINETSAKLGREGQERSSLTEQLDALEHSAGGESGRLEYLEAEVETLQETLERIERESESMRSQALHEVQMAAQQRAHAASLARQLEEVPGQLERATQDCQEATGMLQAATEREASLNDSKERVEARLEYAKTALEDTTGLRHQCEQTLEETFNELGSQKVELTEKRSRLVSLQEIAKRFEGFSDGVQALMAEGGADAGLLGPLVGFLRVPESFEAAIESVLGDRLQYLVAESDAATKTAVDRLRSDGTGRCGFVSVESARSSSSDLTAGGRRAADIVGCEGAFVELKESLLQDIFVVDSFEEALALAKDAPNHARFVTTSGDVVQGNGVVVGGAGEGGGLLAQQREMRELITIVEGLEAKVAALEAKEAELKSQREGYVQRCEELDHEVRRNDLELTAIKKDVESAVLESRRARERHEFLVLSIEQRTQDRTHVSSELKAAEEAATKAEAARGDYEAELQALGDRRGLIGEELEEKAQQLTALKVQIAGREQRIRSLRDALERLSMSREDQEQRVERAKQTLAHCETSIAGLTDKLSDGEGRIDHVISQAEELRAVLSQSRQTYDQERTQISEREEALRLQRHQLGDLGQRLNDLKLGLQQFAMDEERIIVRVSERHDVELRGVLDSYRETNPPSVEDIERVETLDRQIKSMGAINLTAIEEFEEVKARYEFLDSQRDDLEKALENLRRAIQKINRSSRERFRKAYDSVNEMFQKIYPRLFRGGQARLELTNAEDLLECGIDIIAQPPGKKLQNVMLMSGGEKALTATALVFSIFLIKPTPFCVMDEVDAPLDEANVGRFTEMLREISKISQFIVITHNKLTMSQTDRIYGITMEEPGMSKVVAVNLESMPHDEAA